MAPEGESSRVGRVSLLVQSQFKGSIKLFPSRTKPLFQSEAKCEAIDMKITSYSHSNKTHFRRKGFALSLVLIMRVFETC